MQMVRRSAAPVLRRDASSIPFNGKIFLVIHPCYPVIKWVI
jgi:hypothetical protein